MGWARWRLEKELCRPQWQIEEKFAEQKRCYGTAQARYRGLRKVTFQGLLMVLAVNIKRP